MSAYITEKRYEMHSAPPTLAHLNATHLWILMLCPMQAAKTHALQTAYRKREAATPRDDAPSAGQIRSLGLLEREDDKQVNVKHGSLLPTHGDNQPKVS